MHVGHVHAHLVHVLVQSSLIITLVSVCIIWLSICAGHNDSTGNLITGFLQH